MEWYIAVWKKYAEFEGRARRKEFWTFLAINCVASIILIFIDAMLIKMPILFPIYALASLIPGISVTVRRLHDTNHSGWWFLLSFVPVLGAIVLFVFTLLGSQSGINKYGPNPMGIIETREIKVDETQKQGNSDT